MKKKQNLQSEDVNIYDVLIVTKDHKVLLGGAPVTVTDVQNLKAEIKALESFRMWRIIQETIKQKAIDKGLILSTNWEETLSAKMMLHNLGIIRSLVAVVNKLPTTYPPPKPSKP